MKAHTTIGTGRRSGWMRAALVAALFGAFASGRAQAPPSAADVEKVRAAIPAKPAVAAAKARTILVFSKAEGFVHGCIPWARETLKAMAEKTGAFKAEFNDDKDTVFKPETLAKYDALVLNSTTQLKLTPEQKQALLDYVRKGGGVVGLHAATDCFSPDEECAKMLGGVFDGHPWGAGGTWAFKADEPKHALNRAFDGKPFTLHDEIYQFKAPYSRADLRVLVVLDWAAAQNQNVKGVNRADKDFAVAWIRAYGKGRVFVSAFGHNAEVYTRTDILTHWLDGIQYAVGDLKADDRPSKPAPPSACLPAVALSTMCAPAPVSPALTAACDVLATFTYDKDRAAAAKLEQSARDANRESPESAAQVEQALLTALAHPAATVDGRQMILRVLRLVATKASVPAVAPFLTDPALSHMARYAIEGVPGEDVDKALRDALAKAPEAQKIGLLGSMGVRRDRKSVYTMNSFVASSNLDLSQAALIALGRVGDRTSASALKKAKVDPRLENLRNDALLACAEQMVRDGEPGRAIDLYMDLLRSPIVAVRGSALLGLAALDAKKGLPQVVAALTSTNAPLIQTAIRALDTMSGPDTEPELIKGVAIWPDSVKVGVLGVLERKGSEAAIPAILPLVKSEQEEVRVAAVKALAARDGARQLDLLWNLEKVGGLTAQAAANALVAMEHPAAAQFLKARMGSTDANDRRRAIELRARRGERALVTQLLNPAMYEDETVGRGAAQALRDLATEQELPFILSLATRTVPLAKRHPLEGAAGALAQNLFDKKSCAVSLVGAYPPADVDGKQMLLTLMGRLPNADTLSVLREALSDENVVIRKAAVTGLGTWDSSEPSKDLAELAGRETDAGVRAAAFRTAAQLLGRDGRKDGAVRVTELGELRKLAKDLDDHRAILNALAETRHPTATAAIESYKDNAELAKDVEEALRRMK